MIPEKPLSRGEQFLSKMAGNDEDLPKPLSRGELYLASLAGMEIELPKKPLSRFEEYLAYLVENGFGGSSDGYKRLASGEYTKTDASDTLSIPVSFNGTPKIIVCRLSNVDSLSDQAQAVAFIKWMDVSYDSGFRTLYPNGLLNIAMKVTAASSVSNIAEDPTNVYFNSSNTFVTCNRISAQTPWRKGTYTWYIFGEE